MRHSQLRTVFLRRNVCLNNFLNIESNYIFFRWYFLRFRFGVEYLFFNKGIFSWFFYHAQSCTNIIINYRDDHNNEILLPITIAIIMIE